MKIPYPFSDPVQMPGTGLPPETVLTNAMPLSGIPGQEYTERRCVPVGVADASGVRFAPDFGGRPAVVVALRDKDGNLTSVHGRYLHTNRGQSKMLTVGRGGGAISFLEGWQADPLILVEGLFDGLSLAVCGWQSVATIGRQVPWLPEVCAGRVVWAAFDTGRPGDANAEYYEKRLIGAEVRRLPPPVGCQDWSSALVKRGRLTVSRWVRDHVMAKEAKR